MQYCPLSINNRAISNMVSPELYLCPLDLHKTKVIHKSHMKRDNHVAEILANGGFLEKKRNQILGEGKLLSLDVYPVLSSPGPIANGLRIK